MIRMKFHRLQPCINIRNVYHYMFRIAHVRAHSPSLTMLTHGLQRWSRTRGLHGGGEASGERQWGRRRERVTTVTWLDHVTRV